jgi:CheY-like chemotaxis protein
MDRFAIVAVALCFVAVIILAVPALADYLRRWRENRQMHDAMQGKNAITSLGAAPRVEQLLASTKTNDDALGWSSEANEATSTDSHKLPEVQPGTVPGREKTVLIADDDPVVVHALARRLQHLGFQVLRSPDAVHALMGAMKTRPDLAILDINMPSGNGLAVCEMMASDPRCAGIPVIIHSVSGDEATKERARRMGAHHVEKSAHSWNDIKAIVESIFGQTATSEPEPATIEELSELPSHHREVAAEAPEPEQPAASRPPEEAGSTAGRPVDEPPTPPEAPRLVPAPTPARAAPLSTPPMCGSARIVCIESPKDRLEFIDHQLSALGMEVTRTGDLEEGFWTCFTDKPHVVIIQSATDRKKLLQVLRRLTEHPVTRSLPVLLIDEGELAGSGELPSTPNLTILKCPVEWKDLLGNLESLLPVFDRDVADPLARRAVDPTPTAADASTSEVGQPAGLTVLCIDDDPVVTRSIAIRLQPYGIKMLAADNGTKGYLTAVKEQPDMILLDLKMPNGEGAYVLSKLKENDTTLEIPVIILTIETHQGIRRKMISAGAAAFLSKPVRWPELFEEMSHCVELPEQLLQDYKLGHNLTLSQL